MIKVKTGKNGIDVLSINATRTPVGVSVFRSTDKQKAYETLIKKTELCSLENKDLRKWINEFKRTFKMVILTMNCDCGRIERKHLLYYYEWAIDERINKP